MSASGPATCAHRQTVREKPDGRFNDVPAAWRPHVIAVVHQDHLADEQADWDGGVRCALRVSSEPERAGAQMPHATVHDERVTGINERPHFTRSREALQWAHLRHAPLSVPQPHRPTGQREPQISRFRATSQHRSRRQTRCKFIFGHDSHDPIRIVKRCQ